MTSETKLCQNCKQQFTIDPEDFAFYAKQKVPPPTFCPQCRLQRRLAFFNLINLYKATCGLCSKSIFSMYAPDAGFTVYCPRCWWGDGWDPLAYGRDYDFSRPFFEQWSELMRATPQLSLAIEITAEATSPYTNYSGSDKNCYLLFNADRNEDSSNGYYIFDSKSSLDSSLVMNSEKVYDSMHVYKVNNVIGMREQVTETLDSAFLRDCTGCQNCFGSANLRNKKYHFFNQAYTKEEYNEEIKKWDLGSYAGYNEIQQQVADHWKTVPKKAIYQDASVNVTGNMIFESRNCKDSFELLQCENSRYLGAVKRAKDSYDLWGWENVESSYEGMAIGAPASNVNFSVLSALNGRDMEYGYLSLSGNDLFGCVSIKKASYCILNKQYSKEEYETLTARIREHMTTHAYKDKQGREYRYGEFFPVELSPFGYNDTMAQKFFPMDESASSAQGYKWQKIEPPQHAITISAASLPDHIRDANDSVLDEVIGCAKCARGFRITPAELRMLKSWNLPLPRLCPRCRIESKMDLWVAESQLVMRACDKCGQPTQAPAALKDHPMVYCTACYNAEIV